MGVRAFLILILAVAALAIEALAATPAHARQDSLDPALERLEAEAVALAEAGRLDEADARAAELLDLELEVYGPDHPLVANTHAFRSNLAGEAGDPAGAERHRRLELSIRERIEDELALAETRRALGTLLVAEGRFDEARALLEPAHAVLAEQLTPTDDQSISAAQSLGRALYELNASDEALAVLAPAAEALSDPAHDASAWAPVLAYDYGVVLVDQGRPADAEPWLRRACGLWSGDESGPGAWPGEACLSLAGALIDLGRADEAEPWLDMALADPALPDSRRSHGAEQLIGLRGEGADEALLRMALDASMRAWGDHTATAYAANRLGLRLRDRPGREDEAIALFEQAQAIYVADEGPGGAGVMITAANAAYALVSAGRADEAVARLEAVRALADPVRLDAQEARDGWRSLTLAYAEVLEATGRPADAREELTRLSEGLRDGGAEAGELAEVHVRIAQIAARQRDWPGMLEHRRLVLEHREGLDDPYALAMARANYGQVLGEVGDTTAAYGNLSEALALLDGVEAAALEDRLYVMTYLGVAMRRLGRLDEADALLTAVADQRRRSPDAVQDLARALERLADLRVDQNRFPEAEALYTEVLALVREDEEAVSFVEGSLGLLWRQMGRYDEAEAALHRVLDYTTRRYGADSVENATPLRNLAVHLAATGRTERALDVLLQVQALEEPALSPDDPGRLTTRVRIGRALMDLGRPEQAEPIFAEALERAEARLGGENRVTQEAATQLGFAIAQQGRYEEAAGRLRRAAELTEGAFGSDSPQMINVLQLLSYALYMDGRYDETIAAMRRAERITDAEGARWPTTVVDVKANLGRTYIEAGRPAEALAPLRQAADLASRMGREQATASGARPEVSRAPFRALVQAAWTVAN